MPSQETLETLADGAPCFARYRTKRSINTYERTLILNAGYHDFHFDTVKQYIYSCDRCMEEAGNVIRTAWDYSKKGFLPE